VGGKSYAARTVRYLQNRTSSEVVLDRQIHGLVSVGAYELTVADAIGAQKKLSQRHFGQLATGEG